MRYESNYKTRTLRDDELMHWKYIKREKKNGRWVYYYDDNGYADAKKKASDYKKGATEAQLRYAFASSKYKLTRKYEKEAYDRYTKVGMHDKAAKAKEESRKLLTDMKEARARASRAGKAYVEANERYKKLKIKTLAPRIIAKGAVKVANFLSKLTPKKKK